MLAAAAMLCLSDRSTSAPTRPHRDSSSRRGDGWLPGPRSRAPLGPTVKVLWLGHFVPWPPVAGALIRSFHLVREASRTCELALLCLNQKARLPRSDLVEDARRALSPRASIEVLPIPAEGRSRARERVALRSTLSGRSYDEVWLSSRALTSRLKDLVSTFRPDVIHFDTVGLAPHAAVLPSMPLVLNHHNIESQMMERRSSLEPATLMRAMLRRQARALARLERSTASRFRSHLVVSELDGERLSSLVLGTNISVIPNGVDRVLQAAVTYAPLLASFDRIRGRAGLVPESNGRRMAHQRDFPSPSCPVPGRHGYHHWSQSASGVP